MKGLLGKIAALIGLASLPQPAVVNFDMPFPELARRGTPGRRTRIPGKPKPAGSRHMYPAQLIDVHGVMTIHGYDTAVRNWLAVGRIGFRPHRDGQRFEQIPLGVA